ncbi:MAG: hypothetical protein CBC74_005645 [Crocinitomicaceae bacterium TMED114]|nr:MAG: hypothetical protein CBC74_005645 [Crocinitomicaceae bacterium TMED114]
MCDVFTTIPHVQVEHEVPSCAGFRLNLSALTWGRTAIQGVLGCAVLWMLSPLQAQESLDVAVVVEPGQTLSPGWILVSPRVSANQTYPIIVNGAGDVVYNQLTPLHGFNFDQNPDGRLSWFSTLLGEWHVLDSSLTTTESVSFNGASEDYHDLELRADGTRLLMGKENVVMDLFDSIPPLEDPERAVIDCLLQEQDAEGNVTWFWRATEHIPPTWCTHCNWEASLIDAYHHNAFETQADGNILLCLRNMDLVVLIDRQTGDILWHLGGPESDFAFTEANGAFAQQHDAQLLPNDRILIYDNATGSDPLVSRGVEYQLNLEAGTATLLQDWPHPEGSFASSQGSIQRLADGGTLIGWGNALSDELGGGSASEFAPNGALRGTIYFPGSNVSYRARKVQAGALPLHMGCTHPEACNFSEEAIVDQGCVFVGSACDDGDVCTVDDVIQANCGCAGFLPPPSEESQCQDAVALNFNPCSVLPFDDGSCQYAVTFRLDASQSGSIPEEVQLQLSGFEPLQMAPGGFGTWTADAILESGEWSFGFLADGQEGGVVRTLDLTFPASWDGGEVRACLGLEASACPGCTDPDDPVFSPFAVNNVLCGAGPTGCTVPGADNYDATAFFDDGSCTFEAESECAVDLTGDGIIGVSDVLLLLTYFGLLCD